MIERLGLGARLALFGVAAALLVTAAGGWVLRVNLRATLLHAIEHTLDEDAERIAARLHAAPDGSLWEERGAGSGAFNRIYSGWYWQLHGGGRVLRSRSLWDSPLDLTAAQPIDGSPRLRALSGPRGEALAGVRRQVDLGARQATLEVFGPMQQTEHELQRLDRVLLSTLAALVAALVLTLLLQVHFGLRPLRRLQQRMAQVREGVRERIGAADSPDLDELAREMDRVLERNARVVARARTHAGDLSHALKKPLALLSAQAEGAQVAGELVRTQVASMARLVDRHLARAGSGAGELRRIDLPERLQRLLALMRQIHAARALDWSLVSTPALRWRGEPTDLEEMLGNLLDNAGKWAARRVQVQASADDDGVQVCVDDDGPGLSQAQIAQAMQRRWRFDESTEGEGLGLAIVADIAQTYGGRVELQRSALGGLRARLVLPA